MPVISLSDIVHGIEIQSEEAISWLNPDTGKVETVSKDLLQAAEESDPGEERQLPEWQKQEWEAAQAIVSSGRYLRLPSAYDFHEWSVMQEFALAVEAPGIRDELMHALRGRGAFQRFKAALGSYRLEKSWFAFREEALKLLARTWCEQHSVPFK